MKRYLLDSNAITSFVNHREPFTTRLCEVRLQGSKIGTCEPVLAELFYGIELSASRDENKVRLQRALRRIICWRWTETRHRFTGKLPRSYAAVVARCKWLT